jgi:TorA maturation chaperone TorD
VATVDVSEVLPSRLYVYTLLQRFFAEPPEAAFLQQLAQDASFAALAEFSQGAQQLVAYLHTFATGDQAGQMTELHQDYNRLFIGPGPLPAPMWESVYLDREHLLFGEDTLRVRQFYARFGLVFEHLGRQPEDHIAIELDFMATLIRRTLAHLDAGDPSAAQELLQAQAEFLQDHLLRWAIPSFEIFAEQAATPYYQGAGRLLTEYLPLDFDLIQPAERDA